MQKINLRSGRQESLQAREGAGVYVERRGRG